MKVRHQQRRRAHAAAQHLQNPRANRSDILKLTEAQLFTATIGDHLAF